LDVSRSARALSRYFLPAFLMDFDHEGFIEWLRTLQNQGTLEYVWFGFDSKNCGLLEPSEPKAQRFVNDLMDLGITVKGKTLKGVKI